MFEALRFYWVAAKGYRLRPWRSTYLQWRLETFFGKEAAHPDARKFFSLLWRERNQIHRFLAWAAERRESQKRGGDGRIMEV